MQNSPESQLASTENVIHITRHSASRATRTLMQASWSKKSLILTPCVADPVEGVEIKKLTTLNLLRSFKKKPEAMVFHEQETLTYLFLALAFKTILISSKTKIVYDIHDIYPYPNLLRKALKPRKTLKEILEFIAFKIQSIKIITVSTGLALYFYKKFNRKPFVVRSVSLEKAVPISTPRNHFVHFAAGTDRFPFKILPLLLDNRRLYCYGIGLESVSSSVKNIFKMGPYSAHNLSFLRKYMALVIAENPGKDKINNYNIKHSLPNKLFQALSYCLPVIIYGELAEAEEFFGRIDGFIYKWNGEESELDLITQRISARKFGDEEDIERIRVFLKSAADAAKKEYQIALK